MILKPSVHIILTIILIYLFFDNHVYQWNYITHDSELISTNQRIATSKLSQKNTLAADHSHKARQGKASLFI